MPHYRIMQAFQGISGVPQDRFINDWCVFAPSLPSTPDWTAIFEAFIGFYDEVAVGAPGKVSGMFSPIISQGPHTMKAYELETPAPHLPLASTTWDLAAAPGDDPYPEEVALVLSFHGDITAGTDVGPGPHLPARHRNRVYIGPLETGTGELALNGCRPTEENQDVLLFNANGIRTSLAAYDPDILWSIWSPTRSDGEPVRGGWVDNAFDTQRRRGVEATSRRFFGDTP